MTKLSSIGLRALLTPFFLFIPSLARAQMVLEAGSTTGTRFGLQDKFRQANIPVLINGIIQFALGIVGIYFFLVFLYGGFLWMTSSGSGDQTKKAKKHLTSAVIGLVIVVFSYIVVSTVIAFIGRAAQGA